jgi:hypothetical protein
VPCFAFVFTDCRVLCSALFVGKIFACMNRLRNDNEGTVIHTFSELCTHYSMYIFQISTSSHRLKSLENIINGLYLSMIVRLLHRQSYPQLSTLFGLDFWKCVQYKSGRRTRQNVPIIMVFRGTVECGCSV